MLKIGNHEIHPVSSSEVSRFSLLVWGASGSGKTTLACTAPGKKLIINLDPDGETSVKYRGDTHVIDLSKLSTEKVLQELKHEHNPLGLDKFLDENKDIETVILDSATSLSIRALESAVSQGIGRSNKFTPTMEAPGLSAYGGRNAILLTCIRGLLRVTGRHNVHCIITTHEDNPTTNDEGVVLYISMMLGGKLINSFSLQMSDIWWLREDGKGAHLIAVRPCRAHKPMKTRIFVTDDQPEFPLKYDPEDWKNIKNNPIANWWASWEKGKGKKLALPK